MIFVCTRSLFNLPRVLSFLEGLLDNQIKNSCTMKVGAPIFFSAFEPGSGLNDFRHMALIFYSFFE